MTVRVPWVYTSHDRPGTMGRENSAQSGHHSLGEKEATRRRVLSRLWEKQEVMRRRVLSRLWEKVGNVAQSSLPSLGESGLTLLGRGASREPERENKVDKTSRKW